LTASAPVPYVFMSVKHGGRGMGRGDGAHLVAYVCLAAALHLAAATAWGLWLRHPPARPDRPPAYALLQAPQLSPQQLQGIHQARRQRRAAAAKVPPKPIKEKPLSGQVVDVAPSADRRPPEQSAFLSEVNSRVETETRSRLSSRRHSVRQAREMPQQSVQAMAASPQAQPGAAAAAAQAGGPAQPPVPKPMATPEPQSGAAGAAATQAHAQSAAAAPQERLALQVNPLGGQLRNTEARRPASGSQPPAGAAAAAAPKPEPTSLTLGQLIPAVGSTALLGGGPSNDALRQVALGDATLLNTREFKYASYFNRLKRQVSEHWRPLQSFDQRDPTGNIYGYVPRTTTVCVTLSPDGTVNSVDVKRSSGVTFLDDEAVAAFQRAKGFPNPPRGLVDPDGHISFLFGFQVDMTGR
jgi:TonB family protein